MRKNKGQQEPQPYTPYKQELIPSGLFVIWLMWFPDLFICCGTAGVSRKSLSRTAGRRLRNPRKIKLPWLFRVSQCKQVQEGEGEKELESYLLLCELAGPISHGFINEICVSVQSLSPVPLFATPWTTARQGSLSITNSQSLLKLMSIKSVMPSNHLILWHPLLLPPSIFPSIRVFSSELVLHIRWPKYWSFSFSISPSNEYSGLISFRMD